MVCADHLHILWEPGSSATFPCEGPYSFQTQANYCAALMCVKPIITSTCFIMQRQSLAPQCYAQHGAQKDIFILRIWSPLKYQRESTDVKEADMVVKSERLGVCLMIGVFLPHVQFLMQVADQWVPDHQIPKLLRSLGFHIWWLLLKMP